MGASGSREQQAEEQALLANFSSLQLQAVRSNLTRMLTQQRQESAERNTTTTAGAAAAAGTTTTSTTGAPTRPGCSAVAIQDARGSSAATAATMLSRQSSLLSMLTSTSTATPQPAATAPTATTPDSGLAELEEVVRCIVKTSDSGDALMNHRHLARVASEKLAQDSFKLVLKLLVLASKRDSALLLTCLHASSPSSLNGANGYERPPATFSCLAGLVSSKDSQLDVEAAEELLLHEEDVKKTLLCFFSLSVGSKVRGRLRGQEGNTANTPC